MKRPWCSDGIGMANCKGLGGPSADLCPQAVQPFFVRCWFGHGLDNPGCTEAFVRPKVELFADAKFFGGLVNEFEWAHTDSGRFNHEWTRMNTNLRLKGCLPRTRKGREPMPNSNQGRCRPRQCISGVLIHSACS